MKHTNANVPKIKLNNGIEIPQIGLGTYHGNKPDFDEIENAVLTAIDVGYTHFDCAFDYKNEEGIGRGFEKAFAQGKVKREDLFVVTKVWLTYTRRDRVRECLVKSLAKLRLEYVDLFLMHWPMSFRQNDTDHFPLKSDGQIDMDETIDYLETWQGMEECYREGLVKGIGVCNFSIEQLTRLLHNCTVHPVIHQFESHPYLPQYDLIKFCHDHNIAVTAYSPLGNPTMQDKNFKKPEHGRLIADSLVRQLADKHNRSPAQILLRYQINRNVIVVPRSVIRSEMIDNLRIFEFELDQDDINKLDSLNCGWRSMSLDHFGIDKHKYYPFK